LEESVERVRVDAFIDAPIVPASFYSTRYEPREEITLLIRLDRTRSPGDGENTRLSGFSPGIHVPTMVLYTPLPGGGSWRTPSKRGV
jgi:hypothetical protein